MRISHVLIAVVALLLVVPLASAQVINSPQENRTYTHSTNLYLEVDLTGIVNPANCTYQLTWYGDITLHGDFDYPQFTYGQVPVSCADLSGGLDFNVDFDGRYTINVSTESMGAPYSDTQDFYVDREELDGSKVLAGIMYSVFLLLVCGFIFWIGQKFSEEHSAMKLLFTLIPIFLIPLVVYSAYAVVTEFFKIPSLHTMANVMLFVVLIGIIFIFSAYLMIHLTRKALEVFKIRRK